MSDLACQTCRFWDGMEPSQGKCRVQAPGGRGGWPMTNPEDWCGQHLSKEEETPSPQTEVSLSFPTKDTAVVCLTCGGPAKIFRVEDDYGALIKVGKRCGCGVSSEPAGEAILQMRKQGEDYASAVLRVLGCRV